jgi:LPXTG-motif cell wall-anchored protein
MGLAMRRFEFQPQARRNNMNTKRAIMAVALVAAVIGAGASTALADKPDDTGKPEFVTFCHAAGRADEPANWITLTLPYNAVYGTNGASAHFNEQGTTLAGHEQDYLGECEEDTTETTEPETTVPETTQPQGGPTPTQPQGGPTPTPPVETTVVTSGDTVPAPPKSLPSTGGETWVMAIIASLVLAGGTGLTWLTRRS